MDFEMIGLLTLLFLSYVMPFALGLTGALHITDCPQQPYIPIYLGVGGLLTAVAHVPYLKCSERCAEQRPAVLNASKVFIFIVLFCWFLAGSVWVYSIYPPNYDSSGTSAYCAKALYLFAFWFTNICYVIIAVGLIIGLYFYFRGDQNICSFFRSRTYDPLT